MNEERDLSELIIQGERPSAYEYIAQALFGQRMATTTHFCTVCGVANSTKRCRGCKVLIVCISFSFLLAIFFPLGNV